MHYVDAQLCRSLGWLAGLIPVLIACEGHVDQMECSPCLQRVTFLEGGPGILAVKTAILSTLGDRGSALAAQQVTILLHLAVRPLPASACAYQPAGYFQCAFSQAGQCWPLGFHAFGAEFCTLWVKYCNEPSTAAASWNWPPPLHFLGC